MTRVCSSEMTHHAPDLRARYVMIDGAIRSTSMLYGMPTIVST